MKFALYIARRYLFAKKSHNIINIISIISVIGVATGVMALVVVLSVYNGFDSLTRNLLSSIDADLKVTLVEGKTFSDTLPQLDELRKHPSIAVFSEVLEENAIFRYNRRQHVGTLKGVSQNYAEQTGLDSMMLDGTFQLWRGSQPLAVIGRGVAYYLEASLAHFDPIGIYMPRRGKLPTFSTASALTTKMIMPSGIFGVEQDFDSQYIITPIEFVRELLNYQTEVTAIELKLTPQANAPRVQKEVERLLGDQFRVQNRFQQNESIYRTLKSEKFVIVLILMLILIIASFNMVGMLSMLIIDKRKDVETLRSLGANNRLIQKIFLAEGLMVSVGGSILGALVGLLICWLQIKFKLVKLHGMGGFIVDAYPVDIQYGDIMIILLVVLFIGFLAAQLAVRLITKRIFKQEREGNL